MKDIVEGSIRALEANESGIYNLGSGQARSFNELVEILNRSLGTDFKPEYIENPHAHYQNFTQADLTSVRDAFGYQPQFSLETGRGRLHALALSRLTQVAQAMKAKRRSKSPEEINAALAAKKGPVSKFIAQELSSF